MSFSAMVPISSMFKPNCQTGYGEVNLTGTTFACPGTPMFHAQGVSFYLTSVSRGVERSTTYICLTTYRPQVVSGLILGVFPPTSPPTFPTPDNVLKNAVAVGGDYVVAFPPFVEVSSLRLVDR